MPDTDPSLDSVPTVQDRTAKPPGVLPRNTQAWLIAGIALLMVIVIAFSGKNPSKERTASMRSQTPPIVEPNEARIQEYRVRMEEQARKLAAEQDQLIRAKQTPGSASAATMAVGGATYSQAYSQGTQPPLAYPGYSIPYRHQSWAETDKEKREYQSLFASNVALSYRKEVRDQGPPLVAASAPEVISNLPASYPLSYPGPAIALAGPGQSAWPPALPIQPKPQETGTAQDQSVTPAEGRQSGERGENENAMSNSPAQEHAEDSNRAGGKKYRLLEGTVIETVLANRLDGSFSGPVNCMVTTNLYSQNGQRLLIPQGSRVFGEVRKVETFGQQRLAVVFHRLIMPDGYSVSLDRLQGLNQIGETGLVDQVNHHYLQIFGVSLAIGAIAGLSQANTQYGLNTSAADAYRQGVATSLSQSSMNILDRYLNVLPTFTIREGYRVKVYLTDDLRLPAYEKHDMPNDL